MADPTVRAPASATDAASARTIDDVGLILAAAPFEDFIRRNIPVLSLVFILLLALLALRLIVKTMTRVVVLGFLALLVIFVYVERDNINECAQTCTCTIAGFDAELPACDPKIT